MRPRLTIFAILSILVLSVGTAVAPASADIFNFNFGKGTSEVSPSRVGTSADVKTKAPTKVRTRARVRPQATRRKPRLKAAPVRQSTATKRKLTRKKLFKTKPKPRFQRVAARKKRTTPLLKRSQADRVNSGRVGLISGGIGGTYIRIATDLASVLNEGNTMRILPIVGQGSVQNITDILYLKGVDVGIVQSDVLAYIKARGLHRNIDRRIHYITKLYNEEFHLVGGREIEDIRDLEGKAVNFGVAGSGTFMTATTVFEALGINVRPVSHDQALAIEKIRNGDIAATVFVAGKPASAVGELKGTFGLQLIPVPYDPALQGVYLPAQFSAEDYPELVASGETVNSIAVGAVMAVYNWSDDNQRRKRVDRFVNAFFSRINEFRSAPRHKKWQEVNLAAKLPGWRRFRGAERWLTENARDDARKLKVSFSAFLDQNAASGRPVPTGAEREALFRKFIAWQKSRP